MSNIGLQEEREKRAYLQRHKEFAEKMGISLDEHLLLLIYRKLCSIEDLLLSIEPQTKKLSGIKNEVFRLREDLRNMGDDIDYKLSNIEDNTQQER